MSLRTIATACILGVVAVVLAQVGYGAATSWAQTSSAQLTVSLERSFGPGWLQSIVALPGGGYTLAGRRGPFVKANIKTSVFRLDEKGDIVWERAIEGKTLGLFSEALSLMPNGQLALMGPTSKTEDWVAILDVSGKVLSEKSFGVTLLRRTGMLLPDGGWTSVGNESVDNDNPILFRLDANGRFLSKRALPDPALNTPTLITQAGLSGFAVAWIATADGGEKGRPRVIRFHAATWEPTWDTTIDLDPQLDPGVSLIAPLPGGGLAIAGVMLHGDAPLWVAVIGADGRTHWLSRIGRNPSPFPLALAGLARGGVVIGGCAFPSEGTLMMPWLTILDAKGNLASESIVPMQNGGGVLALASLPTGEFAAAGTSGNGCPLIEAGMNGANTWLRVMRPDEINQPR